jgi:hypothetical protein
MKTTLDLDDQLLETAKRRAADAGKSLKAYVEDALRAQITPRSGRTRRFKLVLPTVAGTRPPAVDVADRRALYDFLDENS